MGNFERSIGFLANKDISGAIKRLVNEDEIFLILDSGRVITFKDALHHLLSLGSTGSGKSQTVIYPALMRLLAAGAFGLIIDIKGNMRPKVRALAKKYGRENDIIEYGTSLSATPLNLLKGMGRHELRQFFEQLTLQNFKGASQSIDWHMKGVSIAADCGQLILFLGEKYSNFSLDCRLVYEMISEPAEARKLYEFFKAKAYDPDRPDHRRLVTTVENNRFHALKTNSKFGGNSEATLEENLSWSLQGIRDGLRTFLEAPGVERNFCCPEAPGLDLSQPMRDGKVVIVRFDLDTGPIGARLARTMISHFYSSIFEIGLTLPKDKKAFVCIDEFQEVADLSDARFSDSSFVALAREFNCIFMAATQSMSALLSRGADAASVMSFASNCNNKIVFYSDDPITRELVARYDPIVSLAELKPGEAFAATYDQQTRTHEHGLETLNQSYYSVKDIIADDQAEPILKRAKCDAQGHVLSTLTDWSEKETKMQRKQGIKAAGKGKEQEMRSQKTGEIKMQQHIRDLIDKFPDMFDITDDSEFCLPAGWIAYIEKVFRAFQATGIEIKINGLRIDSGIFHAVSTEEGKRNTAISLFNSFLSGAHNLCVICGKPVPKKYGGRNYEKLGTCKECLQKFGLATPEAMEEDDDEDDDPFLRRKKADFG